MLQVVNPPIVDALDEPRSTLKRFPGSSDIMYFLNLQLQVDKLLGKHLFRLPHRASPVIVSAELVTAVASSGLSGLVFEPVGGPEIRLTR